jgi:hypothetical protein
MAEVYKGPIVYIIHPMIYQPEVQGEQDRIQIKNHRKRISQLLRFAKEHGLPIVFEPWNEQNRKAFFELAKKEGIAKEEIVINRSAPELREMFLPSRIIVAGTYRGRCVKDRILGIKEINAKGVLDVFPNTNVVLLKGSYSLKEPFDSFDLNAGRKKRLDELKTRGVLTTKKLGQHVLNPAWPLPARQQEAKPSAQRKRPAIVPRRALRSAAHRI